MTVVIMDQLREVTVTESSPTTLVTVSATGMQGPQGNPTTVNGKTGASITLVPSDLGAVALTAVGAASGVASLDSGGLVPIGQIPVTALAGDFLDLSTNQTIATGIKTFSVSPVVPTPTTATQAAPKGYVDSVAQGLNVKPSAVCATTAALASNAYANGSSGVGATLTASANGVLTVDGHSVVLNDTVLVMNEVTAANNGLYICTTAGTASVRYVLTRSTSMDQTAEVPGAFIFVESGTANAGAGYVVSGAGPYTIGTTAINFSQFSGAGEITAGTGLTKSGNTMSLTTPVAVANGGTGQATAILAFNGLSPSTTLGDTLSNDGTNDVRVAGNSTTTRKFFRQTGTGSASALPVWDTLTEADIPANIGGRTDWFNVKDTTYGAKGDGTTDDTSAINSALSAANTNGGGTVYLPWGNYLVSGPLNIPPFVRLVGQTTVSLNLGTFPSTLSRIIVSAAWAPGSSAGVVQFLSKTPGGWSVNMASAGMWNIFLDCSLNTSTNLNGINFQGPCYDIHLQDVMIYQPPHDGITASGVTESGVTPTFPYHQRYDRVTIGYAGLTGFNLVNFTDSTYTNCLAFQNTAAGFAVQNCSNSVWTSCRSEWNEYGFSVSGSSGSLVFTGCTTDQNSREGLYVNTATAQTAQGGGVIWTGGKLHADANGAVSGHTNGILVTGSSVPVTVTGTNVECGQNPNSLNYFPATAINVTSSSNVTVTGCILQGISQAYLNGGTNTNINVSGCLTAVGNPGSQTLSMLKSYTPIIAGTTIANTATKTQLAGFTIPGGEPEIGATYELEVYGVRSITGTPTVQFGLYWGGVSGTSLVNSAVITEPTSGISAASWRCHALVTFRTATTVTVEMKVGLVSNTSSGSLIEWLYTSGSTAVTVTSSSNSVLALGFTWGTASASNTITAVGGELVRNI